MWHMEGKKYLRIWWQLTTATTQIAFLSRFGAFIFTLGKLIRFFFFLLFILLLIAKTQSIVGYSFWQVPVLYLGLEADVAEPEIERRLNRQLPWL